MTASGPSVDGGLNYANALNSSSQSAITPTSPMAASTKGDMGMYATLARLGPEAYVGHMKNASDPTFKIYSLAAEYEKPATRFPLSEYGSDEISLKGGVHLKSDTGVNPLDSAVTIYDANKGQTKIVTQGQTTANSLSYVPAVYTPTSKPITSLPKESTISPGDIEATIEDIENFLKKKRVNVGLDISGLEALAEIELENVSLK